MKTKYIKRVLSLIAAISLAVSFSGCQTADGLGQDVENLGENMQN